MWIFWVLFVLLHIVVCLTIGFFAGIMAEYEMNKRRENRKKQ